MGVKRSEYRAAFVKTPDSDLASDFQSKFGYRLHRRSVEHTHTPFEWDYSSDSDSEYEIPPEPPRPDNKENKTEQKRRQKVNDFLEAEGNLRYQKNKVKERREKKSKNEKPVCEVKTRPKRPVKPVAYRTIPKPAPLEGGSKRKARQEAQREACQDGDGGIFAQFGLGDKERETGALKTFNVKSSADIHPSALRARKRLESDVIRREERARSRPYIERDVRPKISREPAWDSEYRNSYPGYQPALVRPRVPPSTRFYVPL